MTFSGQFLWCLLVSRTLGKAGEITRYLTEQGLSSGPYDILIAAQALVSGSTLVTHNTRHFENIPLLKLADWVEKVASHRALHRIAHPGTSAWDNRSKPGKDVVLRGVACR